MVVETKPAWQKLFIWSFEMGFYLSNKKNAIFIKTIRENIVNKSANPFFFLEKYLPETILFS